MSTVDALAQTSISWFAAIHVRGQSLERVERMPGRILHDAPEGAGVPADPLPDARASLPELLDSIPNHEGVHDVALNIDREVGLAARAGARGANRARTSKTKGPKFMPCVHGMTFLSGLTSVTCS